LRNILEIIVKIKLTNFFFNILYFLLDLKELRISLTSVKDSLKYRLSSTIIPPKIEMENIAYAKKIESHKSFEVFSGSDRKSLEISEEEETIMLKKEISSLKQENVEMKDLIKSHEQKIGDLEMEIENLKILSILQKKENQALALKIEKKNQFRRK